MKVYAFWVGVYDVYMYTKLIIVQPMLVYGL